MKDSLSSDFLDDNQSQRAPNTIKWKGAGWQTVIPDHVYLRKVYLRGSWTDGKHQEVLCELQRPYQGKYIRMSRTNGEDTFQYSAEWEFKNEMPVLKEADPVDVHVAVGTIVMAFLKAHKDWPYYDQADCQVFAQAIFKTLTEDPKEGSSDEEDSFM